MKIPRYSFAFEVKSEENLLSLLLPYRVYLLEEYPGNSLLNLSPFSELLSFVVQLIIGEEVDFHLVLKDPFHLAPSSEDKNTFQCLNFNRKCLTRCIRKKRANLLSIDDIKNAFIDLTITNHYTDIVIKCP